MPGAVQQLPGLHQVPGLNPSLDVMHFSEQV
jgi:hypothetical protein